MFQHRGWVHRCLPQPQSTSAMTCVSSCNRPRQCGTVISFTAFSVPARHGVHWRNSHPRKTQKIERHRLHVVLVGEDHHRADSKTSLGPSVPKSSGMSAIAAGNMPPEAPPGRWPRRHALGHAAAELVDQLACGPAGAILTPGSCTRPDTEKVRNPLRPLRPWLVNQSAPFSTRSRIQ